ncbi:MAG: molecular chaperone TorD family protein, partial [Actinomycetota bacterium]|nr:molecular chaperone TorD family protein [Actinomycetota bacterium]
MTGELVTQAARREVLASTLGRLVLAEPGPGLDELVGTMVDLEALTDAATAVDYERIFLRAAPPYESLFCSADGHQGGLPAAAVAAVYGEAEFTEHDDGGWRVAGPDHLGLELRFHAHLVGRELLAWRADRPDEAAVAIETQRRFLAEHMARWAAVAVRALQPAAVGTPYAVV